MNIDVLVIGAGIYGLYAAKYLAEHGIGRILIIEQDSAAMQRASYINQARVHQGYHYPRSLTTALQTAHYYKRFCEEFDFAIHSRFQKVYAVADRFSHASSDNFVEFCRNAAIPCHVVPSVNYFKSSLISGCFLAEECAFDAAKIRGYFLNILAKHYVSVLFNTTVKEVRELKDIYQITLSDGSMVETSVVVNATYASTNQILKLFDFPYFDLKYEIAEICLCKPSHALKNLGLTIMDGRFFSIMPFGLTEYHSLSAVHYTPHLTSLSALPLFKCQNHDSKCTSNQLQNCNNCSARPKTAWPHMYQLARKYLSDKINMFYERSLFAIKPILSAAEIDDARPTVVKVWKEQPRLISVLSGKINTIYDLDSALHESIHL